MSCYLGIDGGGTKTSYLLVDEEGNEIASCLTAGLSYREIGVESVIGEVLHHMQECLEASGEEGSRRRELGGLVIGLPCYGESKEEDGKIMQGMQKALGKYPFYLTNDVEVGWAGSLGLKPGINVVAGTGSIAYGQNQDKASARSGGWSTFFGDEGSCYWIGRRTMELFSKQAEGRCRKGPLYSLVMEEFALGEAMDFIDLMERNYVPYRSKVASLQRLLLKAADAGDQSAAALYREAAQELFLLVHSVAGQLGLMGGVFTVSYSGGLFHAKEHVLPYLEGQIETIGGKLAEPLHTPVRGAALMALDRFAGKAQ